MAMTTYTKIKNVTPQVGLDYVIVRMESPSSPLDMTTYTHSLEIRSLARYHCAIEALPRTNLMCCSRLRSLERFGLFQIIRELIFWSHFWSHFLPNIYHVMHPC